ncbi:hypothetical protein BJ878DRAFT_425825 [Calycina marina]|uniref:Uncharacterized protein n=1 Tax=Calycina marina TaxID=1763456 RepID=A0A9P7YZB9_9HELO|nr:hypothetical protein BJ878DRAFT_425825 [Calycina marina]
MVSKKKRSHPDIEELLARPWCYYCERDFDDLKILISHQKAKHFKCERCGRRLNTAGGLSVHMNQVHKETLTTVENSLPNRAGLEVEIFGMEGIPEDVVQAHNQRIISGFYQAEAERKAQTGNPTPGGNNAGGQAKKPKSESVAEMKKRLAEHKARKAELAAAGNSGNNTPLADTQSPMVQSQTPPAFNGSPYAPPPQSAAYGNAQGAGFGSYSQEPYAQTAVSYPQSYPQQPAYSGPPGASFQQPSYAPQQSYQNQSFSPGYQPQQGYQAPPGGLPNRPSDLPAPPGLPERPSFGASPGVPFQGAPGQYPGQPQQAAGWGANNWNGQDNSAMSPAPPGYNGGYPTNAPGGDSSVRVPDDIDEIIRLAEAGIPTKSKNETMSTPTLTPAPALFPVPVAAEPNTAPAPALVQPIPQTVVKKPKKEKGSARMVYSDDVLSPEEKMSKMPRYAFVPDRDSEAAVVNKSAPIQAAGE